MDLCVAEIEILLCLGDTLYQKIAFCFIIIVHRLVPPRSERESFGVESHLSPQSGQVKLDDWADRNHNGLLAASF